MHWGLSLFLFTSQIPFFVCVPRPFCSRPRLPTVNLGQRLKSTQLLRHKLLAEMKNKNLDASLLRKITFSQRWVKNDLGLRRRVGVGVGKRDTWRGKHDTDTSRASTDHCQEALVAKWPLNCPPYCLPVKMPITIRSHVSIIQFGMILPVSVFFIPVFFQSRTEVSTPQWRMCILDISYLSLQIQSSTFFILMLVHGGWHERCMHNGSFDFCFFIGYAGNSRKSESVQVCIPVCFSRVAGGIY